MALRDIIKTTYNLAPRKQLYKSTLLTFTSHTYKNDVLACVSSDKLADTQTVLFRIQ